MGSKSHPLDYEFIFGYRDGRDRGAPEPGENRTDAYKHSFYVGRAEISGTPICASVSRTIAQMIIDDFDREPSP